MDMDWSYEKPKEEPKLVMARCPFHQEMELELPRLNYHFLYRCQEAKKHMELGKYYKFCNCGHVFVDAKKYSEHISICEFSTFNVKPICTTIEENGKWDDSFANSKDKCDILALVPQHKAYRSTGQQDIEFNMSFQQQKKKRYFE